MSSINSAQSEVFHDIKSGFLVFLIALPLCLGIASASGFPPIAGLTTAIVGGFVVSWLGGASLSIKGPAAGLIVIALGAVTELGGGDMVLGYERTLAVGVVASIVQFAFARFKMANLGIAMSRSVVHGMLAAIGLIIIAKQIHVGLGVAPHGGETIELLQEIPHSLMNANFQVSVICLASLLILFLWDRIPIQAFRKIPPQLTVLLVTIPMAIFFGLENPDYFVALPDNLAEGFAFPDFSVVFSAISIKYIIMFALVGSIESTLSVIAVDSIAKNQPHPQPNQESPGASAGNLAIVMLRGIPVFSEIVRIKDELDTKTQRGLPNPIARNGLAINSRSDLNKDLLGVSFGNFIAAMLGGLPMISEIVRSKANIDAEAKSHRSNFFHGVFLLLFVLAVPGLLKMIPMAALAAMLILTGSRLAAIKEFKHTLEIGYDQFFLFLSTFLVTILTDLLIGVATGLVLKVIFHLIRGATLKSMFRVQIVKDVTPNHIILRVKGDAAFPSLLKINNEISKLAEEEHPKLRIDLSEAKLIDHTFLTGLGTLIHGYADPRDAIIGIEAFRSMSNHPESTHLAIKPT